MLHPKSDEWKVLDDVQRRAATDSDFRERLLKEPNAALAEVAGRPIPDDFTIRFIEKDASTDALVVLPDLVHETQELSESELEAVGWRRRRRGQVLDHVHSLVVHWDRHRRRRRRVAG